MAHSDRNARFAGKTVLVLGGNSGIGLSSAQMFGAEGANVLLTGRNQTTIDEAVASIDGAKGFQSDIGDIEGTAKLAETIGKDVGTIDVLFVNAGIGAFAPMGEITADVWDQVHSVNLRGCIFAIQSFLPLMKQGGAIVITGSIGSVAPVPGNVIYAAAKAGLKASMRIMAKELVERGIRVNMVSPGPTETPLINRNVGMSEAEVDGLRKMMIAGVPMHRMGAPAEIADAVLFLASSEASFITGADIFVDGGAIELAL